MYLDGLWGSNRISHNYLRTIQEVRRPVNHQSLLDSSDSSDSSCVDVLPPNGVKGRSKSQWGACESSQDFSVSKRKGAELDERVSSFSQGEGFCCSGCVPSCFCQGLVENAVSAEESQCGLGSKCSISKLTVFTWEWLESGGFLFVCLFFKSSIMRTFV